MTDCIRIAAALLVAAAPAAAIDFDSAPIHYRETVPDNTVARLQATLAAGGELPYRGATGRLPALLAALDIPASSQTLVFTHTSLQAGRIGPRNPRAIFFNDDVSVGYVPDGLIEIAASDAKLGTVFYMMANDARGKPALSREIGRCMTCHGAGRTHDVPGWQLRSVHADAGGAVIVKLGSQQVNQTTELSERWGGWYVTGQTGTLRHLGNVVPTPETPDAGGRGMNLDDLRGKPGIKRHLAPHSDVAALLTLEHQSDAINLLVRAGFETRIAEHLGKTGAAAAARKSADERAAKAVRNAADYLCFADEAPFSGPMAGSTKFAEEFAARPPRHSSGRSLREFDLKTRLFKHGVSYMVHSTAFRGLPAAAQAAVRARIAENLAGRGAGNLPKLDAGTLATTQELLAAEPPRR